MRQLLFISIGLFLAAVIAAGSVVEIKNSGVSEDEPFAFLLTRTGYAEESVAVSYSTTTNGTARADVDFVPVAGRLTFAPGELSKRIVPLLDNGEVNVFDNYKSIELRLSDPSPGVTLIQTTGRAWINDNESPADLDLTFNPAFARSPFISAAIFQPDGHVLIAGRELFLNQQQINLARLTPGGSFDPAFTAPVLDGEITYIAPVPDRKIIISGFYKSGKPFLMRLFADGRPDLTFKPARDPDGIPLVQHDGKIVLWGGNALTRLNNDGSPDVLFDGNASSVIVPALAAEKIRHLASVHSLPAGELILLIRNNDTRTNLLIRLSTDGTSDSSFNPEPWLADLCFPEDLFPLRDGGLLIKTSRGARPYLIKLDLHGFVDPNFTQPDEFALGQAGRAVAEIGPYIYYDFAGIVYRTDSVGRLDRSFLIRTDFFLLNGGWGNSCGCCFARLAVTVADDALLIWGDGMAVNSVLRPLARIPVASRALTGFVWESDSPIAYRSRVLVRNTEELAEIKVKRLGSTLNAASIDYRTINGTARAGGHFVASIGTIRFVPFETRKIVRIPLLRGAPESGKIYFLVELFNASTPASLAPPIQVEIEPGGLRVTAKALLQRHDGSAELEFEATGLAPFPLSILEESTDLKNWRRMQLQSRGYFTGDILGPPFVRIAPNAKQSFYRINSTLLSETFNFK